MSDLITPDELPKWVPGETTVDSGDGRWDGVRVRGWRYAALDVPIPALRDYMFVVYRLGATVMNRRCTGDWRNEPVMPGSVSMLTHAAPSHWRWSEPLEVTHVYIAPEAMAKVAADAYERHIKDVELRDVLRAEDPVLIEIAACLDREAHETGLGCRVYVDSLRTQACVHVLRRYANVLFREPASAGGLSHAQRRLLEAYAEERLDQQITLEEFASVAQLSVFHFSRKFRSEFGCPPHAYLMRKRIERAKALLTGDGAPLKAIAAMAGFADQSHMTRIFRRALGATPAEYRKARRG